MGDYGEYITQYGLCPSWALSLGYGGVAAGAVLSNWGSAVRIKNDGACVVRGVILLCLVIYSDRMQCSRCVSCLVRGD